MVVPWSKATPASRGRAATAPRREPSPAAPAGSNAHQGYELPENQDGVGLESGWLRGQQCPVSLQYWGPMEPGWPGPSGTSMGCCRNLCWRMRVSGKARLGQHWDSHPTPSCSSILAKIRPTHVWFSTPLGFRLPRSIGPTSHHPEPTLH